MNQTMGLGFEDIRLVHEKLKPTLAQHLDELSMLKARYSDQESTNKSFTATIAQHSDELSTLKTRLSDHELANWKSHERLQGDFKELQMYAQGQLDFQKDEIARLSDRLSRRLDSQKEETGILLDRLARRLAATESCTAQTAQAIEEVKQSVSKCAEHKDVLQLAEKVAKLNGTAQTLTSEQSHFSSWCRAQLEALARQKSDVVEVERLAKEVAKLGLMLDKIVSDQSYFPDWCRAQLEALEASVTAVDRRYLADKEEAKNAQVCLQASLAAVTDQVTHKQSVT
jgi:hypothetical protein